MSDKTKGSLSMKRWCPRVLLFLYDAIAVNLAYYFALLLRFSDADSYHTDGLRYIAMYLDFVPWYTLACLVIFCIFGLYNIVWRYVGFNDIKKLALLNMFTCLVYIIGTMIIVGRMPVSCYVLGAGIQFILMCLVRVVPRYYKDGIRAFMPARSGKASDNCLPLMIIGLNENTRIILRRLRMDSSNMTVPMCIIDHTYTYHGAKFDGLPVYSGDDAVNKAIEDHNIRCAIIADSSIPEQYLETLRKTCEDKDIQLRDFVIGTDYNTPGIGLRELMTKTAGPVRIIDETGRERAYPEGRSALRDFEDDRKVENVSANGNETVVRIRTATPGNAEAGEDWIRQYREETGSEISFF